MAAEVPMALWMGMLCQTMKGTDKVPPPMPTRLDTTPMTFPAPNIPAMPGSCREGLGFLPDSIW